MNNIIRLFSLIALSFLFTISIIAQADYVDPLTICGDSPFTITPSSDNGIEDDLSDICSEVDILITEFSPVWLELNISEGGELVFTITPAAENQDIDFS